MVVMTEPQETGYYEQAKRHLLHLIGNTLTLTEDLIAYLVGVAAFGHKWPYNLMILVIGVSIASQLATHLADATRRQFWKAYAEEVATKVQRDAGSLDHQKGESDGRSQATRGIKQDAATEAQRSAEVLDRRNRQIAEVAGIREGLKEGNLTQGLRMGEADLARVRDLEKRLGVAADEEIKL